MMFKLILFILAIVFLILAPIFAFMKSKQEKMEGFLKIGSMFSAVAALVTFIFGFRMPVPSPIFTQSPNITHISPLTINLSSDDNLDIYYTLDNSSPEKHGQKYETEIVLQSPTKVRAQSKFFLFWSNPIEGFYDVIPDGDISIDLNESNFPLEIGEERQLEATITPPTEEPDLKWSSSDDNIVSVTEDGLVTAESKGEATITVTVTIGGITKFDRCSIKVTDPPIPDPTPESTASSTGGSEPPGSSSQSSAAPSNGAITKSYTEDPSQAIDVESIDIDPKSLLLTVGDTESLNPRILPSNATDQTVSWFSDDTSVVSVSRGRITANAIGTTSITAEAGGKSVRCQITVRDPDISVTNIELDRSYLTLSVGESARLYPNVSPDNATNQTVSWTTNKQTVVSVSNDGEIFAHSAGDAQITAMAGGKRAICEIKVENESEDITDYFTDSNFKAAILEIVQKDRIYRSDVEQIDDLNVSHRNIESLNGLQYFTNLERLYCNDNKITSLPTLPSNLYQLSCQVNRLTTLPKLPPNLLYLYCDGNQITHLPQLPDSLDQFYCQDNNLEALPELPRGLFQLGCWNNRLTYIDLEGLNSLEKVWCYQNNMTSTDSVTGGPWPWEEENENPNTSSDENSFIYYPQDVEQIN